VADDTLVLLRPDGHVAAIVPFGRDTDATTAARLYTRITGCPPPVDPA
jgi:3-(3-hydroxy-phenyl)propionate hydroxylase